MIFDNILFIFPFEINVFLRQLFFDMLWRFLLPKMLIILFMLKFTRKQPRLIFNFPIKWMHALFVHFTRRAAFCTIVVFSIWFCPIRNFNYYARSKFSKFIQIERVTNFKARTIFFQFQNAGRQGMTLLKVMREKFSTSPNKKNIKRLIVLLNSAWKMVSKYAKIILLRWLEAEIFPFPQN